MHPWRFLSIRKGDANEESVERKKEELEFAFCCGKSTKDREVMLLFNPEEELDSMRILILRWNLS
jgi:hypothetical protein